MIKISGQMNLEFPKRDMKIRKPQINYVFTKAKLKKLSHKQANDIEVCEEGKIFRVENLENKP